MTNPKPLLFPAKSRRIVPFYDRANQCIHDNGCSRQQRMLEVLPQQQIAMRHRVPLCDTPHKRFIIKYFFTDYWYVTRRHSYVTLNRQDL